MKLKIVSARNALAFILFLAIVGALLIFNSRREVLWFLKRDKEFDSRYARIPVYGETHSYQSFKLIDNRGEKQVSLEAPSNSMVEVGVVRTDSTGSYWGYTGGFRFKVFRKRWLTWEPLLDSTLPLAMNERASFRIELGDAAAKTGMQTIICQIEKASPDVAEGYEPGDDISFLAPSVFSKRKAEELNVIVVSFDTLRPDHLGCYGYGRDTSPHIDAFARKGILFKHAISPSPWTTPAHYSLFTSLYPSAHQNRRTFAEPFSSDRTLAAILRDNGYYTMAITGGGSVSSQFGFGNGFNLYREFSSYKYTSSSTKSSSHEDDTRKIFETATQWLEEAGDSKFFMFLHTFECHIPYENTFFIDSENPKSLIERRKALYDGDIRKADAYFGQLMQKLESLDLMPKTVIIFLSDHGDDFYDHYRETDIIPPDGEQIIALPKRPEEIVPEVSVVDHGHSLYEEMVRVPLIFHIPSLKPVKSVLENQVRLIDVMPTILELLNIEYDAPMQGVGLVELARTGERAEDPPAISEFTDIGPERKSIRKDEYKYIWIQNPEQIRYFTFRNLSQYELFDLKNDPGETENIYAQNKELSRKYHTILEEQLRESLNIGKSLRPDSLPTDLQKSEIDKDVLENLKALGYL